MNTAVAVVEERPLSERVASRFGVEPQKLFAALKQTMFRVGQSQEPVNDSQLMALMIVADQYKLNPFTKELFAFADKGGIVPFVSIDGWSRIVNAHPQYDGVQFAWDEEQGAMTCMMFRKDRKHAIVVTEYLAECKRGTPAWNSHPRRMLRHRSFIQCARLAFSFSGIYDRDEAEVVAARQFGVDERVLAADTIEAHVPPKKRATSADRTKAVLAQTSKAWAAPAANDDVYDVPSEVAGDDVYGRFVERMLRARHDDQVIDVLLDEARTVLSPEQYAELVAAAKDGQQPEQE